MSERMKVMEELLKRKYARQSRFQIADEILARIWSDMMNNHGQLQVDTYTDLEYYISSRQQLHKREVS